MAEGGKPLTRPVLASSAGKHRRCLSPAGPRILQLTRLQAGEAADCKDGSRQGKQEGAKHSQLWGGGESHGGREVVASGVGWQRAHNVGTSRLGRVGSLLYGRKTLVGVLLAAALLPLCSSICRRSTAVPATGTAGPSRAGRALEPGTKARAPSSCTRRALQPPMRACASVSTANPVRPGATCAVLPPLGVHAYVPACSPPHADSTQRLGKQPERAALCSHAQGDTEPVSG